MQAETATMSASQALEAAETCFQNADIKPVAAAQVCKHVEEDVMGMCTHPQRRSPPPPRILGGQVPTSCQGQYQPAQGAQLSP